MKSKSFFLISVSFAALFMIACQQNPSKNKTADVDSIVDNNLNVLFDNYWEQNLN
jgi:hypothetical protein